MPGRGLGRCDECICWMGHGALATQGECRKGLPVVGPEARGVWPITQAADGCHEHIGRPKALGRRIPVEALDWRLKDVWDAHLRARQHFWSKQGVRPPPSPTLSQKVRAAIINAIKVHDADLLTLVEGDYDEWKAKSKARAAGIGIFLSPFHTGTNESGTKYLEPERPWREMRGKGDPVAMFSEMYFAAMVGGAKK